MDTLPRKQQQFREKKISSRAQEMLFPGSRISLKWWDIERESPDAYSTLSMTRSLLPAKMPRSKYGTMRQVRSNKHWESTRVWSITYALIQMGRAWRVALETWQSSFGNLTRNKNSNAWRPCRAMITRCHAWSTWNQTATSCFHVLVTTLSEYGTRQVASYCKLCSSILNGFVGCLNQVTETWWLRHPRMRLSSFGTWNE